MHLTGIALSALLSATVVRAADWPQWRGPERNGVSTEIVNTQWSAEGPAMLWRASIGTGFSSMSIRDGRVYTMGNNTNDDTVWCFEATTGKELWKRSYTAKLDPQWYEGGPACTPTVSGGCVYTISKWGDALCLEADSGKTIWQRDLKQEGLKPNRWGFAGSPLLWHDRVILNAGAAGIALDQKTGKVAWLNGTNGAAYASPALAEFNGEEYVLIFAAKNLIAIDPESGKEKWRQFWETGWDTNITDPLLWQNRIFISSFSRGCALLAVETSGPQVLYDSKVLHNHLSPGIAIGEYLYAFNGEAKTETDFRCIHLPTGQLKWSSKSPAFGSVIRAGDKLIVLADKGELLIIDPSPEELKVLARAKVLSGTCWTPPALANGLLYVRSAKGELRCLDLRPKTS